MTASTGNPFAQTSAVFQERFEMTVDGKKVKNLESDVLLSNFLSQGLFSLSYMSAANDVQLALIAKMTELKPGVYTVSSCLSPSVCSGKESEEHQDFIYGPYPKTGQPAASLFRLAYKASALGLEGVKLVITSVSVQQQDGNPYKTMRVQGNFDGTPAYVEQIKYDYIVKAKTHIRAGFDVYCSFR